MYAVLFTIPFESIFPSKVPSLVFSLRQRHPLLYTLLYPALWYGVYSRSWGFLLVDSRSLLLVAYSLAFFFFPCYSNFFVSHFVLFAVSFSKCFSTFISTLFFFWVSRTNHTYSKPAFSVSHIQQFQLCITPCISKPFSCIRL